MKLVSLIIMFVLVLADEIAVIALVSMDADLKVLLDTTTVKIEVQAVLGIAGIKTTAVFSRMGSAEEKFTDWCEKSSCLEGDDLPNAVTVAMLGVAWADALSRADVQRKTEAEAQAHGVPPCLPDGHYFFSLKRAYNDHLNLPNAIKTKVLRIVHTPSKFWLQTRFDQIIQEEVRAEPFTELTSLHEEERQESVQAGFGIQEDGSWTLQRTKVLGKMPSGTEDLGQKYTLYRAHWSTVALKFPNILMMREFGEGCSRKWSNTCWAMK